MLYKDKKLKKNKWQLAFGLILTGLSILFYLIHYLLFKDSHHIFLYLIGDIAFVFIEVLMVTLIIHQLLSNREKKERIEKLNLVIGSFFSEVGTKLLFIFCQNDKNISIIKNDLMINSDWIKKDYSIVKNKLKSYNISITINENMLDAILRLLSDKRDFLLRILENPTLHEHEEFTDLIYSIFHLLEELNIRKEEGKFRENDYEHILGDIKRAYTFNLNQWLSYAYYLQNNYPFLFSFISFNNPFTKI